MKIVSTYAMSAIESLAYQQGYKEQDFMENAGLGIAIHVQRYILYHRLHGRILLLCGKGNNGGDAFVAAIHLMKKGLDVIAVQLDPSKNRSPLCLHYSQAFVDSGGVLLDHFDQDYSSFSLIIDGIFGTGFKGEVMEPYASLIRTSNASGLPILSIDIPSGLNGTTGKVEGQAIKATETIYLGLPKLGFFLQDGWNYVGRLYRVDFGLPDHLIQQVESELNLISIDDVFHLLPPIQRNRHKYQAGYVVGLAGSPGMPGAALLASLAALRGGCGMVRLLHPEGMQQELSSSFYELIKIPYHYEKSQKVLEALQKAGAVFIGPGLGRSEPCRQLLNKVIPALDRPAVIDADALTLLAEDAFLLPKDVILTPHRGEMQRLLHEINPLPLTLDTLRRCQEYVEENKVTLVLKGAPSFIFYPESPILVNSTGDPGMATAGSGDVLTGLLAALLSQRLNCHQAAILGVYLHGLAGEYAAREKTSTSMIASDIISHFPSAYAALSGFRLLA